MTTLTLSSGRTKPTLEKLLTIPKLRIYGSSEDAELVKLLKKMLPDTKNLHTFTFENPHISPYDLHDGLLENTSIHTIHITNKMDLNKNDMNTLFKLIETKRITSLSLAGPSGITEDDIDTLFSSLHNLEVLHITNIQLSPISQAALDELQISHVKEFDLDNSTLSDEEMSKLLSSFVGKDMTSLYLTDKVGDLSIPHAINIMSSKTMENFSIVIGKTTREQDLAIIEIIRHTPITQLTLDGWRPNADLLDQLSEIILSLPHLTHFNGIYLSEIRNNSKDTAYSQSLKGGYVEQYILCFMIDKYLHIKTLNLYNTIEIEHTTCLLRTLPGSNIESIMILGASSTENNMMLPIQLTQEAWMPLDKALCQPKKNNSLAPLLRLSFVHNIIDTMTLSSYTIKELTLYTITDNICHELGKNKSIKTLRIYNCTNINCLGDALLSSGVTALDCLANSENVEAINSESIVYFLSTIAKNVTLTHLDISQIPLSLEYMQQLKISMLLNSTLTGLSIGLDSGVIDSEIIDYTEREQAAGREIPDSQTYLKNIPYLSALLDIITLNDTLHYIEDVGKTENEDVNELILHAMQEREVHRSNNNNNNTNVIHTEMILGMTNEYKRSDNYVTRYAANKELMKEREKRKRFEGRKKFIAIGEYQNRTRNINTTGLTNEQKAAVGAFSNMPNNLRKHMIGFFGGSKKQKNKKTKKHLFTFPRRFSKTYCKKKPCRKMGFTERASCRPYKNCYTRKRK